MPQESSLSKDLLHPEHCIHIKCILTIVRLFAHSWKIIAINAYELSHTYAGQIYYDD